MQKDTNRNFINNANVRFSLIAALQLSQFVRLVPEADIFSLNQKEMR